MTQKPLWHVTGPLLILPNTIDDFSSALHVCRWWLQMRKQRNVTDKSRTTFTKHAAAGIGGLLPKFKRGRKEDTKGEMEVLSDEVW